MSITVSVASIECLRNPRETAKGNGRKSRGNWFPYGVSQTR